MLVGQILFFFICLCCPFFETTRPNEKLELECSLYGPL